MSEEHKIKNQRFFQNLSNDFLLFYIEKVRKEKGLLGRLRRIVESHLSDVLERTGNSYQIHRFKCLQLSAKSRKYHIRCEKMECFLDQMKKSSEQHDRHSVEYREKIDASIKSYDSSGAKIASEKEMEHSKRAQNLRLEIQGAEEEIVRLRAEASAAEEELAAATSDLLLVKAEYLRKKRTLRQKPIPYAALLFAAGAVLLVAVTIYQANLPPLRYGVFNETAAMTSGRENHCATLLEDGRVLVTGGQDGDGNVLGSAEIFDTRENRFIEVEPMGQPRRSHSATLLENGRVLLTGGRDKLSQALAGAEIFYPDKEEFFSAGAIMTSPRWRHRAQRLENGSVLIAGGLSGKKPLASAELYIPDKKTFIAAGSMEVPRTDFTMTMLADASVLIAGGLTTGEGATDAYEVYDVIENTLKLIHSGRLNRARFLHTATLLPDGKVLIAGGTASGKEGMDSAEIYDPPTRNTEVLSSHLSVKRYLHSATLLPDGRVLLAGGYLGNKLQSGELFEPKKETFTATDHLVINRTNHRALLLDDGRVLITGGFRYPGRTRKGVAIAETEIYREARMR